MRRVAVALPLLVALGLPGAGNPGLAVVSGQAGAAAATPFTIDVPDAVLDDLQRRLVRARFPDELDGAGWTHGTDLAYLRQLVEYWRDGYDWRAQERTLNEFPQFTMDVDGLDVHFIHRRSPEPDALPIVLIHGWPGTFFEFWKTVDRLADPVAHGGNAEDAFHVVVPSLPGYGFSERPRRMGHSRQRTARMFMEVMARLGYERYAVQAGDVGASVAHNMAVYDADHVVGLHLNSCGGSPPDPDNPNAGLTEAEIERLRERREYFSDEERGYQRIQATRPQTLGYGLNDSPVGLAAWIVEKYRTWCDCGGDPEAIFTRDELLTTVMILLGDRDRHLGGPLLLRGPAYSRAAVRAADRQGGGADRLHRLPRRARLQPAELGGDPLQRPTVHVHGARRAFRGAGAAGAVRRRVAGVLPRAALATASDGPAQGPGGN